MSLFTVTLLAFALAMDTFAISLSTGATMRTMHLKYALKMATYFGIFQGSMPVIGWSIGHFSADYIRAFDHWIAFVLLCWIGSKMIYESLQNVYNKEEMSDPHNVYILLALSFAVSIDAAAVGISLSFMNIDIIQPAIIIGIITFITSLIGHKVGDKVGALWGRKFETFGGIILVLIGCKILIEHLLFD